MWHEFIHSCPIWRNKNPYYNCAFVSTSSELKGMRGMEVVRVLTFFSFVFQGELYPCAVVHWFDCISDEPDKDTGMWVVRPQCQANISIIHTNTIYRAAHLIPVYST
ncbi:hypothetical protein PAXRUDRAFT_162976 [Paxillus rubicundulus Ve08.2h10]|uniref:Uncharacterized protein n=1 Tax=Paxillus rubicundulus Ve08.2h10 TaxID=930991 RepID=A0A0D0D598_9AGAM|nr:hypothetical protein PAXRUDRAFT_162976 [Paxillus rubicundulus Ve08.2h10]